MHTLHVCWVPTELYQRLRDLAQAQQRSLNVQVILLLDRAVADETRRQNQATSLDAVRHCRFVAPADAPHAVELLAEDRTR